MPQLTLSLSPGECVDALRELVEQDAYIEDLEKKLKNSKDTTKDLKETLKDAVSHRAMLSWRAREGATQNDGDGTPANVSSVTLDADAFDRLGQAMDRQRVTSELGAHDDTAEQDEDDQDIDDDGELDDDEDDIDGDEETGEFLPDPAAESATVPMSRAQKRTG